MKYSDPAYPFFLADARARGYPSTCGDPEHLRPRRSCQKCKLLSDYFREVGIDLPKDYKRYARDSMPTEMPQHDDLERLAAFPTWTGNYSIYKSWGEPGPTIVTTRNGHDGDDE